MLVDESTPVARMNPLRQALSKVGEILVLYLRLLLLAIVLYALIYGYLRCTSLTDVDSLDSHPTTRSDL